MNEKTIKTNHHDVVLSVRDTVRNMQMHYAQTGAYRTEDLNHVLGDPKQSIGLTVPNHYSFSARIEK